MLICPDDLNCENLVNGDDLARFARSFGRADSPDYDPVGDFSRDHDVDGLYLLPVRERNAAETRVFPVAKVKFDKEMSKLYEGFFWTNPCKRTTIIACSVFRFQGQQKIVDSGFGRS